MKTTRNLSSTHGLTARSCRLALLPAVALLLGSSGTMHANTISGTVYCNVTSVDANSTPVPGSSISGSVCATFETNAINFTNTGTANTIGGFLGSNNAVVGPVTYLNGFTSSSNLDFSVLTFLGMANFVNGQTYSATHDDGTVMKVNGVVVVNSPGATAARTDSFLFTGTTGNYSFAYNFSEAQGASVYTTNATNSPVPEPSSMALAGTGLLGAFGVVRRRSGRA